MQKNIEKSVLSYIAGFIDGEGCITASGNYLSLSLTVSNTVRAPLLFMQESLGGSIRARNVPLIVNGKVRKREWTWHIGGESAVEVLLALLPYLIVKKQEAILGIALTAAKGHDKVDIAVRLRVAKL